MSDWVVHTGDCLEVMATLPANSVDAVVTDPPYEIGGKVVRHNSTEVIGLPAWDKFSTAWVSLAARTMKDGASIIAFTDGRRVDRLWDAFEDAGLRGRQNIYWFKHAVPPNPRRSFQSSVEVAVWASKGVPVWNGGALTPNVWFGNIVKAHRKHPTQKPADLMRWLCDLVVPSDGIVLDPFAGSGTTGVACAVTGRSFIGIEREPEYAEIARARIGAVEPTLIGGLA